MSARTLTAVRRAAARRRETHAAYRAALAAARADGHTLQAVAQAAGVSKQSVFKLLRRTPKEEA